MKVIDLLNKIANGEAPKKIKYNIFELKRTMSNNLLKMYVDEEGMFFPEYYSGLTLNDEVEIIEDKKIKKIDLFTLYKEDMERTEILQNNFIEINDKINEIIDKLNEDKDE